MASAFYYNKLARKAWQRLLQTLARYSEIFRIYLLGEKCLTKVNLYKLYKKWILALNFHKMENMVIHIEKWLKMKDCDLYTGLSTLSTSFISKMV